MDDDDDDNNDQIVNTSLPSPIATTLSLILSEDLSVSSTYNHLDRR